jgi:hypothetical protein
MKTWDDLKALATTEPMAQSAVLAAETGLMTREEVLLVLVCGLLELQQAQTAILETHLARSHAELQALQD